MDVSQNLFFSGRDYSVWFYLAQAVYIFLPWFIFSIVCGIVTAITSPYSVRSFLFLAHHGIAALTVAILHIAILTSNFWLFWPQLVSEVSVSFVLIEQFLKWFHFELAAYAAFVLLWRWRFQNAQLNSKPYQQYTHDDASTKSADALLLSTDEGVIKINPQDIDWLLADDNYVVLHSVDRETRIRSTLKTMLQKLNSRQFLQTHRSAAVNLSKISRVGNMRIVLISGARVPVSRRRHKQLLLELNQYCGVETTAR